MSALYHDSPNLPTKICTTCKIEKDLDDFYREATRKDGHKSMCKSCCGGFKYPIKQLPLCFEAKSCADCHTSKPLDEFGKDQRRCKQCQNERYRKSERGQQATLKKAKLQAKQDGQKVCRKCEIEKPLEDFPSSSTSKDGHAWQCKSCVSYRQYVVDRERNLVRMRNHYTNNKESYHSAARQWREENRERDRELHRQWAQENPLKAREAGRRRKARMKDAIVEKVDYSLIIEQYGYVCHICNRAIDPKDLHMDHVHPIARGGAHSYENLRPSHGVCNTRKKDKLMSELTVFDCRGPAL